MSALPAITMPWAITPAELDAWIARAAPGEERVFAEGPGIPRAAPVWAHSVALVEDGTITVVHRRGTGTTWRYCARRQAAQRRVERPRVSAIADPLDPELQVLRQLRLAERFKRPCPSNAQLAEACRLGDGDVGRKRASYLVGKLEQAGRITVTLHGMGRRSIAIVKGAGR